MDLAAVAKLVTDGKYDKALAAMRAVWTKRSLPRLADAIDALDRLVETPWGPLFRDKKDVDKRGDRVRTFGAQPRDPRFARALLDYLGKMPFTSNDSRGFWSTVFGALGKLDDPRVITAMPGIQKGWNIRPLQREWLDAQAARLLASYAARRPDGPPETTAAETRQLAAIERAIGAAVPAGGDARCDGLLAEIYADPFDDGPRTVLADHLTEAGDPRGEFITLQLLAKPTPAQTRRAAALLAKHERAWIGPLEPVIAAQGVEFSRGFLSGCRVKLKNAMEAERYGHDPSWATVEHLRFTGTRFSYQPFSAQDSGAFVVDPMMKSLKDVNLHDGVDLAMLLRHAWPRLERLATSTESPLGAAGLAALKTTDKLPALVAIELMAPAKAWLASTKFGKRLRDVVLGLTSASDQTGVISWLPVLERLPALKTATIHASRSQDTYPRWTFARDDRAGFARAAITTIPERYDDAVATLAALAPTQLAALTLKVVTTKRSAKITTAQRAAMTAAAGRQTRLVGFRA